MWGGSTWSSVHLSSPSCCRFQRFVACLSLAIIFNGQVAHKRPFPNREIYRRSGDMGLLAADLLRVKDGHLKGFSEVFD